MAKRANPFLEDYIPQSKVHIGLKQFSNNEDRLKKVYEKTLELLFRGAKKSLEYGSSNDPATTYNKKDKMKQLFIGKNGALLSSGSLVLKNAEEKQHCSCGESVLDQASGATEEGRCSYCERGLCAVCRHACARCTAAHCKHCVLTGSEGLEVCMSCYD